MKYSYFLLLIFCLLNLSESKYLVFPNLKQSFLSNLTVTNQNHIIKTNLKDGSDDININSVSIEKGSHGFEYCAKGNVKIKNQNKYDELYCGFTEDKPERKDLFNFLLYDVSSSVMVQACTIDNDAKYFSCFICDETYCYGRLKKIEFSISDIIGEIIGSIIAVIIVISICCCCCYGCNKSKKSHRNNNIPVTNGIPVSSSNVNLNPVVPAPPINNQIVYAVQNPDGTIQYYSTTAAIPPPTTSSMQIPSSEGQVVTGNRVEQGIAIQTVVPSQSQPYTTEEPTYLPTQQN